MAKKILVILCLLSFVSSQAGAQIPNVNLGPGLTNTGGSEFFVGKIQGKPLITVNLLNGVRSPGVYHIPVDTSLLELLSYAGGATDSADLERVYVRSLRADSKVVKYDVEKIMSQNQSVPMLKNDDVVQLGVQHDRLARTALWISVISGITTVALTLLLYDERRR